MEKYSLSNMSEITAKEVGINIKRLRKQAGYEQTKLAAFADLHSAQIAHYERGARMPTVQNLVKIAEALSCSIQYLIYGKMYDIGLDLRGIDSEAQYLLRQLADKFRTDKEAKKQDPNRKFYNPWTEEIEPKETEFERIDRWNHENLYLRYSTYYKRSI